MKKHAYLVIAHNNFYILETLIHMLDDKRNDIYLHIDKKTKNFDFDKFKKIPKESNIYFIKRQSVNWGGFSQIKCELALLKEATKNKYEYYHLLSGVDLPIKTQNQIHKRIEQDNGKLFINYSVDEEIIQNNILERVNLYHFFQEFVRRKQKIVSIIARALEKVSLNLQKRLKINRLKKRNIEIKYGANWISIPHVFAEYVLSKEKEIYSIFKYSSCADELFIQTLAYNSEFKKDIYDLNNGGNYNSCLRSIDWKRGNPYVYRTEDFDELINSNFLFARKFDEKIDIEIINKIKEYVEKQKEKKV